MFLNFVDEAPEHPLTKHTKLNRRARLKRKKIQKIEKRDEGGSVVANLKKTDGRKTASGQGGVKRKRISFPTQTKSTGVLTSAKPPETTAPRAIGSQDHNKSPAEMTAILTKFGSRQFPKLLNRTEILASARTQLEKTAKSYHPVRSAPSSHIFSSSAWEELGLDPRLLRHVQAGTSSSVPDASCGMGLVAPTHVQVKTIPLILNSSVDVVVTSETGSGKTLTYLLPIVNIFAGTLPRITREDGTLALIMVPTRELCSQALEVATNLLRPMPWIIPGSVSGGERPKAEKSRLRKGITILVATPGRLLYHLQKTASMKICALKFVVIDEADRMMDMGFEEQMKDIFLCLQSKRVKKDETAGTRWRTIMLSATQKSCPKRVFGIELVNPAYVDASQSNSTQGEGFKTPKQLSQHVVVLDSPKKLVGLIGFIRRRFLETLKKPAGRNHCKIVIFFTTCDAVDFHWNLLHKGSMHDSLCRMLGCMKNCLYRLHGNIHQKLRKTTVKDFSESTMGILCCTDIAARGLDIPNVNWIVQYDAPSETSEYVHRIGRTARKGLAGSTLLFLRPVEVHYIKFLEIREMCLTQISSTSILEGLCQETGDSSASFSKRSIAQEVADDLQLKLERFVDHDDELKMVAAKAFQSWIGSYTCHEQALKKIFNVRTLHLGHVAKSFALRDAPSKLQKMVKSARSRENHSVEKVGASKFENGHTSVKKKYRP